VLVQAVQQAPIHARADELEWPLLHADRDGRITQRFDTGLLSRDTRYFADTANDLTRTLADRGTTIVDVGAMAGLDGPGALVGLFLRLFGQAAVCAPRVFCAPRVIDPSTLDPVARRLLAAVRGPLLAAGLPDAGFAAPIGAGAERLFLALDPTQIASPDEGLVIDASDTDANPFALFRTRGVAIQMAHPWVRLALRAAKSDTAVAGLALARLVLLAAGKLDATRDHAMTEFAVLRGLTP
jgi:hypothetical protein